MKFSIATSVLIAGCVLAGIGTAHAQKGPANATSPNSVNAQQVDRRCRNAVTRLANTRGRDTEAEAIAFSPECEALRRSRAFDVSDDMAEVVALLRSEGIDFNRFLGPRLSECSKSSEAQASASRANPGDNRPVTSGEFYERCAANARVAAYSEGIVELQRVRQARFEQESRETQREAERREREHNAALAERERQIARDRRAYEAEMAEWRRRVALCEGGQVEYCASE